MRKVYTILLTFAVLGMAEQAYAQAKDGPCNPAIRGKECTITLDRKALVSGTSVRVPNGTTVTVLLKNKSPLESCKNEVKREEIADLSQIPGLLDIIKTLAPVLRLPAGAPQPAPPTTPKERLAALLRGLEEGIMKQAEIADNAQRAYETEGRALQNFYKTVSPYTEAKAGDLETARAERLTAVEKVLELQLPQNANLELEYKTAAQIYSALLKTDGTVVGEFGADIGRLRALLDGLAKVTETLDGAKTKMESTKSYLEGLKEPAWSTRVLLRPDRNARVTGTLTCTSDISGKNSTDPIVYNVTYQTIAPFNVTGGILLSMVPRNAVAVTQVKDGEVDGVATSHAEIREAKNAPQAVPFGFFNVRVGHLWMAGDKVMGFHVSPGAGVNPNNGTPHAEFFLGAALSIDNFYFSVGAHAGHLLAPANGFAIGDRVASSLALPLESPWTWKFAIGASYRIPLK